MTRDEILAVEPGYHLDKLVEEMVFGYVDYSPKKYSTDIAAAWVVVEHMRNEAPPQRHEFRDLLNLGIFKITPEAICKSALWALREEKK